MTESKRQRKFSKMIQKDLSEIFQKEGKNYFGDSFVTITEVSISPDLEIAKVYLSIMLNEERQLLIDTINERKKEIRKTLGNKIGKQVRAIPKLIFYLDNSSDHSIKMDKIFKSLQTPPIDEEGNGEK